MSEPAKTTRRRKTKADEPATPKRINATNRPVARPSFDADSVITV